MKTSKTFESFAVKMRSWLPWHEQILPKDARAWYESLDQDTVQSEVAHLMQLRHVGGAEVGVLIADAVGAPAPSGRRPEDLFDAKLMRTPLKAPDAEALFQDEHCQAVRAAFEARVSPRGWRRADDMLTGLADKQNAKLLPRGCNPGDIFYDESGRLVLVDYQAPQNQMPPRAGEPVPLEVGAALAQGRIVLEQDRFAEEGIHVARTLCVYGVCADSEIEGRPAEGVDLVVHEVHPNPKLDELIVQVTDEFMERVQEGLRPGGVDPRVQAEVSQLGERLSGLDEQIAAVQARLKGLTEQKAAVHGRLMEIRESLPEQSSVTEDINAYLSGQVRVSETDAMPDESQSGAEPESREAAAAQG